MHIFKTISLLIIFSILHLYSQQDPRIPEEAGMPKVYFDVLGFDSNKENESRLDIYVQVPYEALFFVKEGNLFISKYELTINIFDENNNLMREKLWTEVIKTSSYDETISPRPYKLSQQSFELKPGNYDIAVQLRDAETKKSVRISRRFTLRNFSKTGMDVSDVMILNRLTVEGDTKIIIPNITGNVAELNESFFVFMELYNKSEMDSVKVIYDVVGDREKNIKTDTSYYGLKKGNNALFIKIRSENISMGNYRINFKIIPQKTSLSESEIENLILTVSKPFVIKWRGMPGSIVDLDAAIEQMIYIFEKSEIEKVKKLPQNERGDAFKKLWKKKDPTPDTERNELMEEYYIRVEYANKNFKHYIEGWRTDMGMVYIIFGPPNNIDRHPFEINTKPYEVWYYYELNRQFVFVDQTGFGDYQLITPIWDVWQRPR